MKYSLGCISIFVLRSDLLSIKRKLSLSSIYSYLDVAIESQQGRDKVLFATNKHK